MLTPTLNDKRVAYHEAGHVVAAAKSGFISTEGDIVISGRTAEVSVVIDRQQASLLSPERIALEKALCFAAGAAAEARFLAEAGELPDPYGIFTGAHADVQAVRSIYGPSMWNRMLAFSDLELSAANCWQAVEAVAAALLTKYPAPVPSGELTDLARAHLGSAWRQKSKLGSRTKADLR